MTDTIQRYTTNGSFELAVHIAVRYNGWERGSDTALRDELKRIRDTGFTAVRVQFDRDNEIERGSGMLNWRNPDRFFDGAQRAGLKVLAEPGNLPHRSIRKPGPYEGWNDAERDSVLAWIRRFTSQYREHPALLAWICQFTEPLWWEEMDAPQTALEQDIARVLATFAETDPAHPVVAGVRAVDPVPLHFNSLAFARSTGSPLLNIPLLTGNHISPPSQPETVGSGWDYEIAAQSRYLSDSGPGQSIPIVISTPAGNIRYGANRPVTFETGTMTRTLLLMLASGMKTICLDSWRGPTASTSELGAGDSGILDWLGRVSLSGREVGRVATAVERFSQELWSAQSRPQVQILTSLQTDRRTYQHPFDSNLKWQSPVSEVAEARMGAVRALLQGNIEFGFITEENLTGQQSNKNPIQENITKENITKENIIGGSAPVAPILFLPHLDVLSTPLLKRLKELAESGTRIVADMPCGWLDEAGNLLDTAPGSPFEQLFGVSIVGIHYFQPVNMQATNIKTEYFADQQQRGELLITTAKAVGGEGEMPAYTENRVGKGRVLLINLSLSRICSNPTLHNAQLSLLSYLLGSRQTSMPALGSCLVFRRSVAHAEHVFIVNDHGEPRTIELAIPSSFTNVTELLENTQIGINNGIIQTIVPASSGKWLRCSA